jgi:hypothetical protein
MCGLTTEQRARQLLGEARAWLRQAMDQAAVHAWQKDQTAAEWDVDRTLPEPV